MLELLDKIEDDHKLMLLADFRFEDDQGKLLGRR